MKDDDQVPDLKILAPRHLSRRQVLQLGGASALSLWIAACGGSSGGGTGSAGSQGAGADEGAKKAASGPIEGRLLIANWIDYSDPANYKTYTKANGPKITIDGYGSNEELLAKLNAGGSAFDIVAPTGYAVKTMIDKGQALALDHSLLPNLKNLQPKFTKTEYDPGNKYSVPKDYGVTSFWWRTDVVKGSPATLKECFDLIRTLPSS